MPLTNAGKKVMDNMKDEYGPDKGERVFYASRNAGRPGSASWEGGRQRPSRRPPAPRHQRRAESRTPTRPQGR